MESWHSNRGTVIVCDSKNKQLQEFEEFYKVRIIKKAIVSPYASDKTNHPTLKLSSIYLPVSNS